MVKIHYNKITTAETDKIMQKTLFFTGSVNGMVYELKISGYAEQIDNMQRELKLHAFNVIVDLDVENKQKDLTEFKK